MLTLRHKYLTIQHDTHPDDVVSFLLQIRDKDEDFLTHEILHDPMLMPDMERAVVRILQAQQKNEKVIIFGDYDVDGVSSTAALFLFLRDELGMQVSYRLPHRVHDGYGIKKYHMDDIAKTGTKLVITVDCGTKDIEPVEYAKTLGLDVIVTDHHSCPDTLPDCIAVVNPRRRDSKYPFPSLSGSGVVWKLLHAILLMKDAMIMRGGDTVPETSDYRIIGSILGKYIDIVSLGTVADCMPMIDENRTIVRRGLLQARNSHHPFFQTFLGALNRPISTEEDIAFFVGPMLNAGGRITTPYQSLTTLLAGALDSYTKIQELMQVNELRKGKSKDSYEKALAQVDSSQPFLVFIDPALEHGILGLVAARLTEQFHKPSAVFTLHDGQYVGSLRAPAGIDLVKILDKSSDYLARYGGHAGAAGCTIAEINMSYAEKSFQSAMQELYASHDATPVLTVDTVLDPQKITLELVQSIETLRPFGIGFPAPLFMLRDIEAPIVALGQTGEHIAWDYPGLKIVAFRFGEFRPELEGRKVSLIGTLKIHTWRDTVTPQFQVVDIV